MIATLVYWSGSLFPALLLAMSLLLLALPSGGLRGIPLEYAALAEGQISLPRRRASGRSGR